LRGSSNIHFHTIAPNNSRRGEGMGSSFRLKRTPVQTKRRAQRWCLAARRRQGIVPSNWTASVGCEWPPNRR